MLPCKDPEGCGTDQQHDRPNQREQPQASTALQSAFGAHSFRLERHGAALMSETSLHEIQLAGRHHQHAVAPPGVKLGQAAPGEEVVRVAS